MITIANSESDAPVDDGRCFACGPYNEHGIGLRFEIAGEGEVRARVTLPAHLQGWRGIAHGGVVMMLLDEAMAHAAGAAGKRGMTAAVSVRFRRPAPLGEPLVLHGAVVWARSRVIKLEASVSSDDGTVYATGEGNFVAVGTVTPGALGAADVIAGAGS